VTCGGGDGGGGDHYWLAPHNNPKLVSSVCHFGVGFVNSGISHSHGHFRHHGHGHGHCRHEC